MSGADDRSVQGYRAATESLDERPSVSTRNAILAAAARQVQSGPRDARAPVAPARRRQRWPYAAAAAVLLSTLAVMMATRTEQEMPTFTAPADNSGRVAAPTAEPAPAKPAAADGVVADAAPTPAPAASKPAPKVAQREAQPAQVTTAPASPAPPPAPVSAGNEAKLNAATEPARAKEEVAGLSAAPAEQAASAEAPGAAADIAIAPMAKRPSAPLNESAERRRDDGAAAAGNATPRAAQGTVAGAARSEADLSAGEWLDRIVKLRRAGRHDEADAELKRFRERYPQVTIPPEAQAPAGTR
jgi:hypothetical protein